MVTYSLIMERVIKISEAAFQALSYHSKKEGKTMKEIASFLIISNLRSNHDVTSNLNSNHETERELSPAEEAYFRATERKKVRGT